MYMMHHLQGIPFVEREVSRLDVASISNVADSDPKLWAHLVSVFVITFIILRVSLAHTLNFVVFSLLFPQLHCPAGELSFLNPLFFLR